MSSWCPLRVKVVMKMSPRVIEVHCIKSQVAKILHLPVKLNVYRGDNECSHS